MNAKGLPECFDGHASSPTGMSLDFDLNYPPAPKPVTQSGLTLFQSPQEGQADEPRQADPEDQIEIISDEVAIISPRIFAEAKKNARRPRQDASVDAADSAPPEARENKRKQSERDQSVVIQELREVKNEKEDIPLVPELPKQEDAPNFLCAVCKDQINDETSTKCGHIFCKECIEAAITFHRRCPTCRKRLKKTDTIKVFLPSN